MTENVVLKSHQEKSEDLSDAWKLELQTHRIKTFLNLSPMTSQVFIPMPKFRMMLLNYE